MARPEWIKFKKLHENAHIPYLKRDGDQGLDLMAVEYTVIPPYSRGLVPTGLAVEVPVGFWTSIDPRSSVSKHVGVQVVRGIIDTGYRGELFINVQNNNEYPFIVNEGTALAQLMVHEDCVTGTKIIVADELSKTERGADGFGSTGNTN